MDSEAAAKLLEDAAEVLKNNDRGDWTVPQPNLYPHQWLWDSCFIAIGLRHLDVERAKTEIRSLLRGQWSNGMMSHLIFSQRSQRLSQRLAEGWGNPHSPDGIITSGLTQPPMMAEAVWKVGQKLKLSERRTWFKEMLPFLIDHHNWLYSDRNAGNGLVMVIHPYETGLDNSPPNIVEVKRYAWPWWLKALQIARLVNVAGLVRRDYKFVASNQRMSNAEALAYFGLAWRLQRQNFDIRKITKKPRFAIIDLAFNCIFIKANKRLVEISEFSGTKLPENLLENMERTEVALDELWDEPSSQYYSRSLISGDLIKEPTIAALMPLYAGCIKKDRAEQLVRLLKSKTQFATKYPVPSVSRGSTFFDPIKYWQGSTWVNTNWLIIEGLRSNKFSDEAEGLKNKTLTMVGNSKIADYYNPLTGAEAGAPGFSWTAALTIDLLKH